LKAFLGSLKTINQTETIMSSPIDDMADAVEQGYRETTQRELHSEAYPVIRQVVGQALRSEPLTLIGAVVCQIIDRRNWPIVEYARLHEYA
jgi:hypothetical protein